MVSLQGLPLRREGLPLVAEHVEEGPREAVSQQKWTPHKPGLSGQVHYHTARLCVQQDFDLPFQFWRCSRWGCLQ